MAIELSKKIKTVAPSLTLQITAKAKALKAEGIDVVSFGAGEPDFDTPQVIKDKAIAAINEGFTKYTPAAGIPELKKEIVRKFKEENAIAYEEANIVVSCGAKHSLYNIFQVLLNDGDEVIVPAPYWLSYPEMVRLAGGIPVVIDAGQDASYKVSAAQIEAAITPKTKAVILNSPSNPTGAVYTKEELSQIADVAVKHSIIVVSDEIYEHLLYGDTTHTSIASLNDAIKELTITVNGVSKSYSMTGWRIGYLAANKDIAKAIGTLQSHSTSNPTSFAQVGAVAALRYGSAVVEEMVKSFAKRRDLILQELSGIDTIVPFVPSGTFYVFCNVEKTGLSSLDFATRLLEEANVAVIPSAPFGIENHIRLSFAISDEAIVKGVRRIKEWVASLS